MQSSQDSNYHSKLSSLFSVSPDDILKAQNDASFRQSLIEAILQTRNGNPPASVQKPLSTLIAAGIPFTSMDLSGIKIPGHDLSYAIMYKTNLDNADLSGCEMRTAYLNGASLKGANVKGAKLGLLRTLKLENKDCALSYNGKWIAIPAGQKLQILDSESLQIQFTIATSHNIQNPVFSHDDTMLIAKTNSSIHKIILFDLVQKKIIQEFEQHFETIMALAFSFDNKFIASTGHDEQTLLWEIGVKKPVQRLTGHLAPIYALAFSHSGDILATGCKSGTIVIWDLKHGKQLKKIDKANSSRIKTLEFSTNDEHLLSTGSDPEIKIWEVKSGNLVKGLRGSVNLCEDAHYSSDSKRIISTDDNCQLRVWNVDSGECLLAFPAFGFHQAFANFCNGDQQAIGISYNEDVKLWDLSNLRLNNPLNPGWMPSQLVINATQAGIVGTDKKVRIYDANSGRFVHEIQLDFGEGRVMGIDKDFSKAAIYTDSNKTLQIVEIETKKVLNSIKIGKDSSISSVSFSNSGNQFLVQIYYLMLQVYDIGSNKPIYEEKSTSFDSRFSHDDSLILSIQSGILQVIELASKKVLCKVKTQKGTECSEKHQIVIDSPKEKKALDLFSIKSQKVIQKIGKFEGFLKECSISKDGQDILLLFGNSEVQHYNTLEKKIVSKFNTGYRTREIQISEDGKRCYCCSDTGVIQMFERSGTDWNLVWQTLENMSASFQNIESGGAQADIDLKDLEWK